MVSDTDELELAKQLERLEEANREVAGDDDADSYDDEEGSSGDDWKGYRLPHGNLFGNMWHFL